MALLAEYNCNTGSGTSLTDDSGNGHTGTLQVDMGWTTGGKNGGGLDAGFGPNSGSGVSIPRTGLEPTTALTVMGWFTNTNTNTYRAAISKGRAGLADSYALYASYDVAYRPHFDLATTAGTVSCDAGTTVMSDGFFHHLAATWDGAAAKLYVDGSLVDTKSLAGTISYDTSIGLWIGGSGSFPGEALGGKADDVRIYSHALTAGEISSAMNTPVGGAASLSINAGADQSIYTGVTATITATAAGGTGTKTYNWTKVNGPAGTFASNTSASTTFTPSGAGTYTLRCIVTAGSETAQDDLVLTVTAAPTLVALASVASSTGWTATGGTVLAVLSDNSDATLITSTSNPTNVLLDGTFGAISQPIAGQNFIVRVRARKVSASTGTLTGKLYVATTLKSTVTVNLPDTLGDVDVSFPAADLGTITSGNWASGVRVTLEATAAA